MKVRGQGVGVMKTLTAKLRRVWSGGPEESKVHEIMAIYDVDGARKLRRYASIDN